MKEGSTKARIKKIVVSILVTTLVMGSCLRISGLQANASVRSVSLTNPLAFSIYANAYRYFNHVEGNVAIGTLDTKVQVWEGHSFIGDLANSSAEIICNIRECYLT